MDIRLTIRKIKNTGTTRLMFRLDTMLIVNLVCKNYSFESVEERLDTHVSQDKATKELRFTPLCVFSFSLIVFAACVCSINLK